MLYLYCVALFSNNHLRRYIGLFCNALFSNNLNSNVICYSGAPKPIRSDKLKGLSLEMAAIRSFTNMGGGEACEAQLKACQITMLATQISSQHKP